MGVLQIRAKLSLGEPAWRKLFSAVLHRMVVGFFFFALLCSVADCDI